MSHKVGHITRQGVTASSVCRWSRRYVAGANGIEFTGVKETLLHRVVKAHRDAGLPTGLAAAYIEELLARGADVTLEDDSNKTAAQLDAERSLFGQ